MARCIDCGSGGGTPLRLEYPLERCPSCRMVFARDWQPDFDADIYNYYADREHLPRDHFVQPATQASFRATLSRLGELVPGRALLDVGCGTGELVYAARAAGWDARGIDLSEPAIRICRNVLDVPCSVTDFFDAQLEPGFDVITMIELVEHVAEPSRFLRRAFELLAPDGVLYLTTPNFNSLGRRRLGSRWDAIGVDHLSYFTTTTIKSKARTAGFAIARVRTKDLTASTVAAIVGRTPPEGGGGAGPANQALRTAVNRRASLRLLKSTVNVMLDVTRLGETMNVTLIKTGVTEHARGV